ncbi:uncharacterized protein TRIADDRAFT_52168 [Trichoplax adhaerens]|uniref:COMM domain-containing protein n=1 Tax=Trichoplax adhaerens TaxID=10228 RepID=B3RLY5_TRIAD|nr:hypothetical protein TRIADDRAFT_52168 [Trichoplax adhaerens]EDV28868.1 hypothetical protein TRIADDRAFT_52168 [Trichoplax adhaerens]|eukprot:XP_002108070.1 hypothetical protein TRIADDRAFT_52168 [Trichoplax adhaerens]
MLLTLSDQHKDDLQYLTTVDVEEKLNVPSNTIKNSVGGLVHLLLESAKLALNEIDFQDSVLTLGFSEEAKETLLKAYKQTLDEVRKNLSNVSLSLPHYRNLEWRFDVQVASRALRQQVEPRIVFKLNVVENDTVTSELLQTDINNLAHMVSKLEAALAEMKTNHCRRILRNI